MQHKSNLFVPLIREPLWSTAKERWLTRLCIAFTLFATVASLFDQFGHVSIELSQKDWSGFGCQILFVVIVILLIYGGLVYQITRLKYVERLREPPPSVDKFEFRQEGEVTILVPSYNEERRTIFQTLMSAALQEGVKKRIVLLIDNSPDPYTPDEMALLVVARQTVLDVGEKMRRLHSKLTRMYEASSHLLAADACRALADANDFCGEWFAEEASSLLNSEELDHTDRFYAAEVLVSRTYVHWDRAHQWRIMEGSIDQSNIHSAWSHLLDSFCAEVSSFERKQFVNLSQEPNKAANLNSYLGLLGRAWKEIENHKGQVELQVAADANAPRSFEVSQSEFILTLDADSILLPEYASTLLKEISKAENGRVAVIQTPYSAIPGANTVLERCAGATTDVQYIIHQGFTSWDGTYWVGANAILRKSALDEIAEEFVERGYSMKRFIQDRTVIEDTESTIDLLSRKWQLWNYPKRLAYSATPSDFGSLLIQRRRWANGGLIILPKAISYLLKGSKSRQLRESFFRVHYLVSIARVNLGLILLLAFPFTDAATSFWFPLTAVPYFFLYGRDLRLMEYERNDVLRVYALNLLLILVNLAGVIKSIEQAYSRKKIPFIRTPKVENRTRVRPVFIVLTYLLLIQWCIGAYWDFQNGHPIHGIFAALNALFLCYAIVAFVGVRNSISDILHPSKA